MSFRNNAPENDEYWMSQALKLAQKAVLKDEVPVAALVVGPEGLLGYAINTRERQQSPLGHAELLALHQASQKRKSWRLEDCTLYVTLEPCVMCAGALQQARLPRVVYGAFDSKAGGVHSLYSILSDSRLNHQCEVRSGLFAQESSLLLRRFFQKKRQPDTHKRLRERASAVIVFNKKILVFKAIDPHSGQKYLFLPGGQLEPGETALACATRETLEETGYKVRVFPESELEKKYDFNWNGDLWSCRTLFYLGTLDEDWHPPGIVQDASYHKGVRWLDWNKAAEVFSYSPAILAAVQKLLKKTYLLKR